MKITATTIGDPYLMLRAAEITSGRKPPLILFNTLLEAEHSPCRLVQYWIEGEDVPERAIMHLVRHKIGCEWFVSTSRPDRTKADGKLRNFGLLANHQALVNIARKRLCSTAWYETRTLVAAIKEELPEYTADRMIPECEYRGGVCHESLRVWSRCMRSKHLSEV